MSMSRCFLFRPSRRGSGRSWKKGMIDTDGSWGTTGHPRGSSGAAWERHFTANPSIPECPFAPPGQIAQDSAIALEMLRPENDRTIQDEQEDKLSQERRGDIDRTGEILPRARRRGVE